jgi:2-keto-4-pentenoate hydratase/2-oxohepta-3-ene-1,7-dioic acid hydratase in catechol pathway
MSQPAIFKRNISNGFSEKPSTDFAHRPMDPPPRFLKEGDIVECAIEGVGSIVNRVRRIEN